MFDQVLNTPLQAATKRCSKVKMKHLINFFRSCKFCKLVINFSEV